MSLKPAPVVTSTAVNKPPITTSRTSWLRRLLRICLVLGLSLIALVLALTHALPWLLQQQGVDFQWRDPQWHHNGFSVSQLQLTLPGDDAHPKQLNLENLRINVAWSAFQIQRLQAERLQIRWPIIDDQALTGQTNQALPAAALKWLPQHIDLPEIDANLPGLGRLQGSLNMDVGAQGRFWQPDFIHARFILKDLQGTWLDSIPTEFRPKQLSVQVSTHPEHQDNASDQPWLIVDVNRDEALHLQLKGLLDLQRAPEWQGTLKNAELLVQFDRLAYPALRAEQLQARVHLTAQADAERFSVSVSEPSSLEAHKLQSSDIGQAKKITVQLAGLSVQGRSKTPREIAVHGPLNVRLEDLKAEQLYTQNWDFQGTVNGRLPQLELTGSLTGQHGLSFNSHVRLLGNSLQGSAAVKEVFFKAGNPLQKTFKNWPELVSFNSGRLRSQIDFELPPQGPFKISLNGSANGLNGIVNRSELQNLDMQFKGQLSGQSLKLNIPSLTIEQLNPGIPLESIQLTNARYNARINDPLQGVVDWQGVRAKLLNGSAWLDAQKLDLNRANKVLLHVEGLELQELFKVYPAEGLAGTGIIDGQIPIHIDHGAFYVEAGQLQARQPGVLQFHSDKIRALGESNPSMRIVADALEDFHFKLLSSALSYDQSGKLLLNILLEGQNPDVEKGRPIRLNLNLEEDIPALLASIQLSSQVSEIIQKRVLERLQKR